MLLKLFFIVCIVCFTTIGRLGAVELKDGSGGGFDDRPIGKDGTEEEEEDFEGLPSADGASDLGAWPKVTVSVNQRQPPNALDKEEVEPDREEEEEEEDNGGGGIVIDEGEDNDEGEEAEADETRKEPVPVKENSLITHPGILAAIIVGGILVLVCLVAFFILIVCCVRRKDEGTYDLDEAMKQKLKYITYTKADTSDKEFFA